MTITLRQGVSFCRVGDAFIFLDRMADQYFGLSAEANRIFASLLEEPSSVRVADLDDLVSGGLLATGTGGDVARPCAISIARRSALEDDMMFPSAVVMVGAALAQRRARAALRWRGLNGCLRCFEKAKSRVKGSDAGFGGLGALATAFERATLLTSSHERCLPSSIALAHRLCRRGIKPDLVIGVKLGPFAAHCWVQLDDMVVSDRVETVRVFTPILAL